MSMATATLDPAQDDEDPVLHELDVYISKSLGKVLLAQYPLRPTYKPYQNAARESVKMRPVQSELEVDMVIQNNLNKPKQIQKLTVSQRPLLKPNTAIGLLRGHELHLTPLDSVVQLTPSFEHIDKRVAEDAKLNEKEERVPVTAVQSVTRKLAKVETERDKAIRLSSFENIQTERQKEAWVPCDYRPPEHPYTAGQKRAMMNKKETKGITGCEVSKAQYLDMLLPGDTDRQLGEKDIVGITDLHKLTPDKQVETLLRNGQVLSYCEICNILSSLTKEQILSELQNSANLVQGHWVISSKLLYPKDTKSALTGAPADLMVRHRNFILCCFVHNSNLKRKHLQVISKIHPDEIMEILKQVSVFAPHEGWTFRKPYSALFAQDHPDIAQSQKLLWNDMYEELYVSLHLKAHKTNPLVEKRLERNTVNKELTSLSLEAATEIVESLQLTDSVDPNHIVEISNDLRDLIGQGAGLVENVEASMLRYIPPDNVADVLKKLCSLLSICHISVLTQEGEREEALGYEKIGNISDNYRQVIFSLFESRYQISKSELRDAIHQQFQTTLTNKEYQSITTVLCESPTAYKSGHWVLKVKRKE